MNTEYQNITQPTDSSCSQFFCFEYDANGMPACTQQCDECNEAEWPVVGEPTDIEYLQSVGFIQDNSKNSGLYYYEDDNKTKVIVPQEDGSYKLEFYEMCDDGNGNYYEDFDKEYSKKGQSLQQFIEEWI